MADKTTQMKTKIAIEGEKEYKAACDAINGSLKTLGSEMKLITATYADNATGADALRAKQEVLKKILAEQTQKADEARKMLDAVSAEFGEGSAETQKYQQALNNAQTAMIKTTREIGGIEAELKKLGGADINIAPDIEKATAKFSELGSVLKGSFKGAMDSSEDSARKTSEAYKGLGGLLKDNVAKSFDDTKTKVAEAATKVVSGVGEMGGKIVQFGKDTISGENSVKALGDALREKLEERLKGTSKGMDEAGESADDMADDIGEAADEADDAGGKFEKLGGVLKGIGAAMGAAAAAAGAAIVGITKQMADMTVGASKYADDILTMSSVTGMSTDSLQAYKYAAELVDVSIETLSGSLAKNNKSMANATDTTKGVGAAYAKLGVSVRDSSGQLRDNETVYWETIDALGKMENETERDALSMQILGKSAKDLNPLIEQGSAGIKELAKEAESMGAVMNKEALEALGNFDDSVQRLNSTGVATKNLMGTVLLPQMQLFADAGVSVMKDFNAAFTEAGGGAKGLEAAIKAGVASATKVLQELVPEMLDMVSGLIDSILSAVSESAPMLIKAIQTLLPQVLGKIAEAIPLLIGIAVDLIMALVQGIVEALPQLITAAMQIVTALITGIADALPDLIPAAVEAIVTIVQGLIDNMPMLLDAALQLILGLTDGLLAALPQLIEALPAIIKAIVDFVIEAIPQIIEAGIQLLTSLVEALPDIITSIVKALPQIIDSIVNGLLGNLPLIIKAGLQLFTSIIGALPEIISAIVGALPQIIGEIVKGLIAAIPQLIDAGWQLLTGLLKGILNAVPELLKGVGEVCKSLIGGVKDFFGIHSPSTVFAEMGENMAAGMGIGFDKEMDGVGGDMQKAVGGAGDATAQEAIDAINKGIIGNVGQLAQAVNAIVTQVLEGLRANNQNFVAQGVEIDKALITGMLSVAGEVVSKVMEIIKQMIAAIREYNSQFVSAGEYCTQGIWQGFQNKRAWLEGNVRAMMQSVVAAVKSEMQIASPSRVFAGIGDFMAQGLGVGFEREMAQVSRDMASAIPTSFDAPGINAGGTAGGAVRGGRAGADVAGGMSNLITGNTFVVREEADIDRIARKLLELQKREQRKRGCVA